MDLSKLSDEQLALAEKVAIEARRQGLDERFVLPMVMAESGFNPKAVSKKGAIGVMQLMPNTAKMLGVDPNDVDQNIQGGVRFIKQLIEKEHIGNNPNKILMAYNAGPDANFFYSGDLKDLPDETLDHVLNISKMYGGEIPSALISREETQEEVKPEQGETVEPFAGSETKSEADKPFIGIAGGNIGLGVASAIETGKRVAPLLPNLLNTVSGQQINPSQPVSRMSLQRYLNSQIAPNLKLPLTELEKVTGGAKIRTMSEVQNALRAIQAVEEQKTTKPLVKMVPGRPGVFEETGRFTSHTIPGRPGVDLTPYETKAQGPIRSAVQRQLTTAGEVGRTVAPSLARIGGAGLGGASAAVHGYEAFELAKKIEAQRARGEEPSKEDLARLAAKGSAAVGGGLSMFPFGVTQIGGLALSAPELGFTLYDWLRERKRRTANEPRGGLESVDPMGNPLGVAP